MHGYAKVARSPAFGLLPRLASHDWRQNDSHPHALNHCRAALRNSPSPPGQWSSSRQGKRAAAVSSRQSQPRPDPASPDGAPFSSPDPAGAPPQRHHRPSRAPLCPLHRQFQRWDERRHIGRVRAPWSLCRTAPPSICRRCLCRGRDRYRYSSRSHRPRRGPAAPCRQFLARGYAVIFLSRLGSLRPFEVRGPLMRLSFHARQNSAPGSRASELSEAESGRGPAANSSAHVCRARCAQRMLPKDDTLSCFRLADDGSVEARSAPPSRAPLTCGYTWRLSVRWRSWRTGLVIF